MATTPTIAEPAGRAPAPETRERPVRVIERRKATWLSPLTEGWRRRGMWPFFAVKALQKIYARTWLGILWLPLRPGIDLVLKVGVIGALIAAAPKNVNYLLYAIVGMTAWELFDKLSFWGTRSFETNRSLIRQMYVPRMPMLCGALGPAGAFFLMYLLATLIIVAVYVVMDGTTHLAIGLHTVWAVVGLGLIVVLALMIAMFLAPIAMHARDVRFTLNYAQGFWFFITPVLYDPDRVGGVLGFAVMINPISAPIEMIQHGLLATGWPRTISLVITLATIAVFLPLGLVLLGRSQAAALDAT